MLAHGPAVSQSLVLGQFPHLFSCCTTSASACKLAMLLFCITLCTLAMQQHSSLGFEASILAGDQSIAAHHYFLGFLVFTLIRLLPLLCRCSLQYFLQCLPFFGSPPCLVQFLSGEHIPCESDLCSSALQPHTCGCQQKLKGCKSGKTRLLPGKPTDLQLLFCPSIQTALFRAV